MVVILLHCLWFGFFSGSCGVVLITRSVSLARRASLIYHYSRRTVAGDKTSFIRDRVQQMRADVLTPLINDHCLNSATTVLLLYALLGHDLI